MKKLIIIYANILMLFFVLSSMCAQDSLIGYSDPFTFNTKSYTLTLNVEPGENGIVEGEGEFFFGEEVEVLAIAEEGWKFVEWVGDTEYIDDPTLAVATVTIPARNIELTANFEMIDYLLTLEVNPEESGNVEGEGEYNIDEEVEITAQPIEGWGFDEWTGDAEYVDDAGSAIATVTMQAKEIKLIANFSDITTVQKTDLFKVELFPNPTHDKLTVTANEMIKEISLISIKGQQIINLTVNESTIEINVDNMQPGVYFIKIDFYGKIITDRVQIIR